MTATRPEIVTPAYAAAFAADYITAMIRHGWRPTNAQPVPDWQPPHRKPPPDVARRGAACARDLLGRTP
jgi:hypothetical protein